MTSPRAARVQTWGFFFATSGGEWNPHKKILFDEAKPIIICRGPQMALHPPPENPIGSSPCEKFRWLHPFLPSKGAGRFMCGGFDTNFGFKPRHARPRVAGWKKPALQGQRQAFSLDWRNGSSPPALPRRGAGPGSGLQYAFPGKGDAGAKS